MRKACTIEHRFDHLSEASMPTAPQLQHLQQWVLRARQAGDGELTEAQVIDRIRALEELKAVAAAEQARLTAHLYAERQRREAAEKVPAAKRCAGLGTEIALARRVSRTRATG